jgi:hypothetical protein
VRNGQRAVRLLRRVQRAQDLLGDVDARAEVHRVLHDQVEFLLFGDLADDPLRALEQALQFLVAALVQVFAELTLAPLQVAVELGQFALPARTVGLSLSTGASFSKRSADAFSLAPSSCSSRSRLENSASSFWVAAFAGAESRRMRSELT